MDFRGYLGVRDSWRVLGLRKEVEVRTLRGLWECTCIASKQTRLAMCDRTFSGTGKIKTYALKSSLRSGLSLLGALRRLGSATYSQERRISNRSVTELAKSAAAYLMHHHPVADGGKRPPTTDRNIFFFSVLKIESRVSSTFLCRGGHCVEFCCREGEFVCRKVALTLSL